MVGKKFQIYGVHIPRKCMESWDSHSCLPPQSKLSPNPYDQSLRQRSFKNSFPLTVEIGGRTYDLLNQNSIRKCEDDLEH